MSRAAQLEFLSEVQADLVQIDALIEQLHQAPLSTEAAAEARRLVHNITGSAAMLELPRLSALAQHTEVLLEEVVDRGAVADGLRWNTVRDLVYIVRQHVVVVQRLAFEPEITAQQAKQRLAAYREISPALAVDVPDASAATADWTSESLLADMLRQAATLEDEAAESLDDVEPTADWSDEATSAPLADADGQTVAETPSNDIPYVRMADLSPELAEVFLEEAEDYLATLEGAMHALRADATTADVHIPAVRRAAHSLKGSSGAVGFLTISRLAHLMEDLLDEVHEGTRPLTPGMISLFDQTTDAFHELVHGVSQDEPLAARVQWLARQYRAEFAQPALVEAVPTEPIADVVAAMPTLAMPAMPERPVLVVAEADEPSMPVPAPVELAEILAAAEPLEVLPAHSDSSEVMPLPVEVPAVVAPSRSTFVPPAVLPTTVTNAAGTPFLRVPLDRVDALVRLNGELLVNRTALEQRLTDFHRLSTDLQQSLGRLKQVSQELEGRYGVEALKSRRPSTPREYSSHDPQAEFDPLEFDRYGEFHLLSRSLAETTGDLGALLSELRTLRGEFDTLFGRQNRLSRESQERLLRIRMLPLSAMASRLERVVRNVAAQRGKQITLELRGQAVEIDKTVFDRIADPLMHALRNAADHGIESPDERLAHGKPAAGRIVVEAAPQGTQLVIRISDDGRGLDHHAIRRKAVEQGLVSAQEAEGLTDVQLQRFVFQSGFSTAAQVTEISGRGVGLDVLATEVQRLKGSVTLESHAGQGLSLSIRLPTTLATARALLVNVGEATFAVPLAAVQQILRTDEVRLTSGPGGDLLHYEEQVLPVVCLARRWGWVPSPDLHRPLLLLNTPNGRVAVVVDRVGSGREIVVKPLGPLLRFAPGYLGATLQGNGQVVPILDPGALAPQAAPVLPAAPVALPTAPTTDVMIVDDSVSVRRVLKGQLQAAGYRVLEAKDGVEALEQLRLLPTPPRAFLLDVEMPRMDGYELLTALRRQAATRDTPIAMITSRAGEKHRNKAQQLGATAYLVKPYQPEQLLSLLAGWWAPAEVTA